MSTLQEILGFVRPRETFTSSGTFDVPSNVQTVYVTMIGGGGGGAASRRNSLDRQPGGGGGGQFLYRARVSVTPGASVSVTVGSGGAGGSTTGGVVDGSDGTASSFGSLSCPGGTGGTCPDSNVAQPNHGGAGSTRGGVSRDLDAADNLGDDGEPLPHPAGFRGLFYGNTLPSIGEGGAGASSSTQRCGGGGGGFEGDGGDAAIDTTGPVTGGSGDANSGAGGGAAHLQAASGTATGGDGADGIVIVEW